MELRHLAGFLAVADELHFGRAAARLHVAQPALSQRIQQLERDLGVRLFDRSTRTVRLTPAGEAFRHPAARVLAEVERAREAARGGARSGVVRIGFTRGSTYSILPMLTRAIRAAEPGIDLRLHGALHATEGLAALRAAELDLAFVRVTPADDTIATRVVRNDELRVVLADSHPLATHRRISLSDLAHEPFVTFPAMRGSAARDALLRTCLQSGFDPRIVQESNDADMILSLVAAGVGVSLMPYARRPTRVSGIAVRRLAGPAVVIPLELAWRHDDTSRALRRVLEIAAHELPTPV